MKLKTYRNIRIVTAIAGFRALAPQTGHLRSYNLIAQGAKVFK